MRFVEYPDLSAFDTHELCELAVLISAEQQVRAVAAADPMALVELGFSAGFKTDGTPLDPWLQGGILICPGARLDKSASSHECGFARIDDVWVWESDSKVIDVVRHVAARHVQMRSVTLIASNELMKVDMIYAKMRSGAHQLKTARSFIVKSGELSLVTTRSAAVPFRDRPNR